MFYYSFLFFFFFPLYLSFFQVLLQILLCFSILTKIPPTPGGGNCQNIYIPESPPQNPTYQWPCLDAFAYLGHKVVELNINRVEGGRDVLIELDLPLPLGRTLHWLQHKALHQTILNYIINISIIYNNEILSYFFAFVRDRAISCRQIGASIQ